MAQFDNRPFVPQTNQYILNAIRKNASPDYRARIPAATQATMAEQLANIMDFEPARNEFINALVNRIGLVIARSNNWNNPLAKFKRGILSYGETIEEIQVGLLQAHEYSPEREYLEEANFGVEVPDVQSSFHTRNRKNYYRVTINEQELRRAFLEEGGLSGFISQLMAAPTTSDQWDEFILTARLFREYYDNDGFFKVNVPNVAALDSTADDAKAALRAVRTMADNLPFISTAYNAAGMPVSASADELELFVTPEFNAAVDVEALAAAFNIDRAQIASRQTVIRQQDMNIPGAQAILTSRDFFVIADTYFQTTSQQNAAGRTMNYFLHHDQVVSASRFVPAILFTTEPSTPIVITDPVIASIADIVVTDRTGATVAGAIPRGDFYNVTATPTTTPEGGNVPVIFTLAGAQSDYTKLSQNGTLFVGVDETASQLSITASDTDGNPTKTVVRNLSGEVAQLWPSPQVLPAPTPPA